MSLSRESYELQSNETVARALGMKPVRGLAPGLFWDFALKRTRLLQHSTYAGEMADLGVKTHAADFVFDIFKNPEDLLRAESHLGIASLNGQQRAERILETINQQREPRQ